MRDREQIVSRATDVPVVQTRGFGRRPRGEGTGPDMPASAASSKPLPTAAPAPRTPSDVPAPTRRRWLRFLLVPAAFLVIYFLQFSTIGLPSCASTDARNLLTSMSREALAKSSISYQRIDIADAAAMPAGGGGTHKCEGVLTVDGRPFAKLVYEITWSVRLVIYNRYKVTIVSATR